MGKVDRIKSVLQRTDASDLATLEREVSRLREVIQRTIGWIDQLEAQAHTQAQQYRGRFDSLADACAADAKNYRATADNLRKQLA